MIRRKKLVLITILAGVAITTVASMNDGFFGGTSVCSECGRTKRDSRTYWIPSTHIEETALSRFHDELAGGKEHEHHWLFAHGGGGEVMAIGQGRHLLSAINQQETRQALELIRKHRGDETAKLWLGRLLDPKSSQNDMSTLVVLIRDGEDFEIAYREMEELEAMKSSSATLK
jgi:hypothetical protein